MIGKDILNNAGRSIAYFKYKTKYAKNKPLHVKHLNSLIDLYNAVDFFTKQSPQATIIKHLVQALYAELLLSYPPHIAIQRLLYYVKYHEANEESLIMNAQGVMLNNMPGADVHKQLQIFTKAGKIVEEDINNVLTEIKL